MKVESVKLCCLVVSALALIFSAPEESLGQENMKPLIEIIFSILKRIKWFIRFCFALIQWFATKDRNYSIRSCFVLTIRRVVFNAGGPGFFALLP